MEIKKRVYALVKKVPKGRVTSYGCVARRLGTSSRAVGQILKRNPYVDVPCHRVVMSNGSVGGYCGKRFKKKIKLLRSEGVVVKAGRISKECFHIF